MTETAIDADQITRLFTRPDGAFRFARWGRALAPVVYGTNDEGIAIFEAGVAAVAGIAGLEMHELDPELGANFMVFFCNDWRELAGVPHLAKLIPGLDQLISTLSAAGANQYRVFGFDEAGAIRICITLLRYDDEMQRVSAQTLALTQSVMGILLWSETAFASESPIALIEASGQCVVKPWYADLISAAYDPVLPAVSGDSSLSMRLMARIGAIQAAREG